MIGWATHSDHLPVDVDPAEERAPGHHRRRGQRAQTGDHTDQQSEQNNDDVRHREPPIREKDNRTLTRSARMIRLNQKRQNRMSEARIALAPIAASSSMIALTSRRGTSARTATHAGSASGAIVGDSSPGVIAVASSRSCAGSHSRASDTAARTPHPAPGRPAGHGRRRSRRSASSRSMSTASESHSGSPNATRSCSRACGRNPPRRRSRRRPRADRNLHGAVEPDHSGFDPACRQVFSHQIGERGGDSLARKVFDTPLPPRRRRIAEGRRPEAERKPLTNGCVGFLGADRGQ